MTKNNGAISSILIISIVLFGSYQWYKEKHERNTNQQEHLRRYLNATDEEYTESNKETKKGSIDNENDSHDNNSDSKSQKEECTCLKCGKTFYFPDGIRDMCSYPHYYLTAASGKRKMVITDNGIADLTNKCKDFCSKRCYDAYHSENHNGHEYGSTSEDVE